MTDPVDERAALALRCEQASGPDRELDVAIFRGVGAPVPFQFANKLLALTFDEARQAYFADVGEGMHVRYEPPNYTASLDAAMTLVPEGCTWLVDTMDGYNEACVHGFGPVPPEAYRRAATPALALCAAALRAHLIAKDQTHD